MNPLEEPLVGVRGFLVVDRELHSLVMPCTWHAAEVGPAVCYSRPAGPAQGPWQAARDPALPDHRAPREGCRCGFGAYHPEAVASELGLRRAHLLGIVIGWGDVLPGTRGWRSSFARLMAVALPPDRLGKWARLINPPAAVDFQGVADAYGVPMVPTRHLGRVTHEFGRVLPYQDASPSPNLSV